MLVERQVWRRCEAPSVTPTPGFVLAFSQPTEQASAQVFLCPTRTMSRKDKFDPCTAHWIVRVSVSKIHVTPQGRMAAPGCWGLLRLQP